MGPLLGAQISTFLTYLHLAENLWPEEFGSFIGLDRS